MLTNGRFLVADVLPSLLPHLAVLRVSIPPFLQGYDHLQTIHSQIEAAVGFRNEQGLGAKIMASLLIRPRTPKEEIASNISILSELGVDSIRLKPTHMRTSGDKKYLDIRAYHEILEFIRSLNAPNVVISKINQLQTRTEFRYPLCYYSDFNPFNIGADGKIYACCEQKYKIPFLRGNLNQESAKQVLERTQIFPFPVKEECFAGCKGDLANIALSRLVEGYKQQGDNIFAQAKYQEVADEALVYLVRSSPQA